MAIDEQNTAGDDASAKAESEKALDVLIPEIVESENNESSAGAGQQSSSMNAADSLAGLLGLLSIGLGVAGLKQTAAVWNNETNKNVSAAAIPVLQKYGWGQRFIDFLNGAGGVEELALFMALVPVGVATVTAFNADMAAKQKTAEPENDTASEVGQVVDVGSPLKSNFTRTN